MADGAGGTANVSTAFLSVYDGVASGTVTIDTTVKEHGYGSLKHDSAASASAYRARLACLADAGRRISVRMRFAGYPASSSGILRPLAGTATACELRLNSTGKLLLYAGASGGALQATGTTTLSLNTFYRIAFCYTITSASVSEFRVYLDGNLELTASNPATQVTGTNNLRVGWTGTTPGANVLMYHQDLYVDDSTALTDPGDIRVSGKMPASTGTSNAFDTAVGAGTNRWDRVNERPTVTTTGYTQAGTSQVIEEYGVEPANVGDDDLTGVTILGWGGWVQYTVVAAVGSILAQIIVNAVLQSTTTTAGSGAYQTLFKMSAVTTYPGTDAVGLRSTGSAVDTTMSGCGVFVAYTPAAGGAPGMPRRNLHARKTVIRI